MSCLKFDTLKEYLESLKSKSDDELKYEIKNHIYINKKLLLRYNYIKSHIYLDCIKVLEDYISNISRVSLEKIEKCLAETIENCALYLDIAIVQTSNKNIYECEVSNDDLYKRVEGLTRNTFRYFNTLNELCVNTKNYLNYLYIKLFDKKYSQYYEQFVKYEIEFNFDSEEEIKKFEEENALDDIGPSKFEIVSEIYYSIISDIGFLDRVMIGSIES